MNHYLHRLYNLPQYFKAGPTIAFLAGFLISFYSALPRAIGPELDYLFFPIIWLWRIAGTLTLLGLIATYLPGRMRALWTRSLRCTSFGFAVGYIFVALVGFNLTGYWLRFVLLEAGLRDEKEINLAGWPSGRAYYFGASGFAGLENDYFLISDPTNRLADVINKKGNVRLRCPLAGNYLLWPSWRLLITDNCGPPFQVTDDTF